MYSLQFNYFQFFVKNKILKDGIRQYKPMKIYDCRFETSTMHKNCKRFLMQNIQYPYPSI